jgi:hypothetical protein
MQHVDILIQHQVQVRLQYGINQEIYMALVEHVRHLLEQFIERNSGLIVAFLCDLI